jgi:formate hydrogenlyase transcriptional activator
LGVDVEIDERKRAESLLAAEMRTLEMVAGGASLTDILEDLCRTIDSQNPDASSTVLLMDPDGERLWPAAGPRVPVGWAKTISPLRIGPQAGSCGTAAFLKERVITEDIDGDPLWKDYRDAALRYGLRASWSQPLISKNGGVLGTFAMYYPNRRSPSRSDLQLIEGAAHIALIAIERCRTEEALQESEDRFRCMADKLPEVIWITALEPEKVLYASPSFERVWGLPLDDLYKNPRLWTESIHPEDRERMADVFARWISSEPVNYQDVEFRIVRPNGEVRWIHERGVLERNERGKPYRVSGISTDITERRQAEEALRRSEAYLAEAQRLSLTGSFGWHVSSGELIWSKETFCILGYDEETLPTLEHVFQRVHPEDLAFVQRMISEASSSGTNLDFEHRLRFPDSSIKYVHVLARAVRDEAGRLEFVGAVSDITAVKLSQERIRRSERELREIVDAIPQLITVLAPNGDTLYVNKPVLEFTGLSLEAIQAGALPEHGIHHEDRARLRAEIQEALTRGVPFETEHRIRGRNGQFRWFLNRFNPFLDDAGQVVRWYVTGIDIEERKRAEERVQSENLALREEINRVSMFEEIVGSSDALNVVLGEVAKVALTDSTVLILGETGTGKELIARAIHKRSKRSAHPFIRVNCAAIPPSLIASELFGYEKGAFTGALQRRLGRFESAEGGTIFLDEIGELPMETQLAFLRVLQEREFERVGSSQPISVDVRVVAATNRNLQNAVEAGMFRQDLFYRLNVFPIRMPPLRERVDDIPLLVEYLIERYAKRAGKKIRSIDKKTLELFRGYDWPGNIRELQNVIERAVVLCEGDTFSVDDTWLKRDLTPASFRSNTVLKSLKRLEARQERELIEAALMETKGRISGPSGAAAKLGIPRQTLESKIAHLGIDKYRFKSA